MENEAIFSFKCLIENPYIKADTPEPAERDILIEAYLQDDLRVNPSLLCHTHFILILDISGSMDDFIEANKTKLQAVIEASAQVLAGIRDGDLISIITFTNTEHIFCWAESVSACDILKKRMEEIYQYPRGATNLAPALKAAQVNLQQMGAKNKDMAIKLLILTDGKVHDVDMCEPIAKEFQGTGVDIDTMGIGIDFHGEDMEKLTSGFMEKLESSSQTVRVFERSLRVLQNTVATKVKVELDPTEGVEIRGVSKISPDIKLLPPDMRIISFENVDRNRRYAAVVRVLIDPAPIGEKAIMTCTLSFDLPKKGIVDETMERVVAIHFTNNESQLASASNSEVLHASSYYTIALKAQEIQDNHENKNLAMRDLNVIISRLKRIGDMETMSRWEAIKDDYIRKGVFSLEEYNTLTISKTKTGTSVACLPPPDINLSDIDDELPQ